MNMYFLYLINRRPCNAFNLHKFHFIEFTIQDTFADFSNSHVKSGTIGKDIDVNPLFINQNFLFFFGTL